MLHKFLAIIRFVVFFLGMTFDATAVIASATNTIIGAAEMSRASG
jgi:hypothetical protein